MDDRITKADWLDQGCRTLEQDGVGALKVGPMSTQLGVTRGSFYWHFRDIADFRTQLLDRWREQLTEQVIREVEAAASPEDRIRSLLRRAFNSQSPLERAIRSWAIADAGVAERVSAVDDARVGYIAGLLRAVGVNARVAASRAAFLYWAYLGQPVVMQPRLSRLSASALDDIAGLFTSG